MGGAAISTSRYCKPESLGISGVREFNYRNFSYAEQPLETHIHPDAIEICFLYRGEQTYCVGNEDYHLHGLDVFITYPNEEHSSGINPEEKSTLYYMIVDTVHSQERFLGIDDPAIAFLPQTLNCLPRRLFRGSELIFTLWESIFSVLNSEHPLRIILVRTYMLELFVEIIRCANEYEKSVSPQIDQTAKYICEHIDEYIPLNMLADISGLSLSRFKAKFREQTGVPPGEYIQRERINRAKVMLMEGKSVTFIAHELNYSSSQHFSTYFKKYVGLTPSKYRKIWKEKDS